MTTAVPAPARSPAWLDFAAGDHICSLACTPAEQAALVAAYVQQGLDRGERVLLIGTAPDRDALARRLSAIGIDVAASTCSGQLLLRTALETYLRDGCFVPERMFEFWDSELARATSDGFSVLRVTGETDWAQTGVPGAERIIEYEARLNTILPGSRYIVLCQYHVGGCPAQRALDVLETHPLAVVGLEAYANFYYVPPEALLGPTPLGAKLEQWMQNLCLYRAGRPAETDAGSSSDYVRALHEQQRELEEFVSTTSHHLREPLRKLRVMSDTVLQKAGGALDPSASDLIHRMQNAAWRACDQLDALREYATIRRPKGILPAVDLNRTLQAVLLDMRTMVEQTSARIHVAPLPVLRGDPAQMRSLFYYLLENALLYSAPGVPPEVRIAAHHLPDWWEITVQDNGIGFEPELAQRLFRPFELAKAVASPIRPNALGLTICRKIVQAHGGAISASSTPGAGSCFTVRLPARQTQADLSSAA